MKPSRLVTLFAVALFAVAVDCQAQTGAKPDQVVQELLGEVHQLRVAMQQMSVNAFRGQIMVERLRLQQESVSRLSKELQEVRNGISELKSLEPVAKERLVDAEDQFERGVISEPRVKELRASLVDMKRRQQTLDEREVQLSIELTQERNSLADLNRRLDELEREMLMTGVLNQKTNPKK
jgi:hypothetical protein